MTPPAVGKCSVCKGLGRVYRAPVSDGDLSVSDDDFGRDYACPKCKPALYNVERGKKRWEK